MEADRQHKYEMESWTCRNLTFLGFLVSIRMLFILWVIGEANVIDFLVRPCFHLDISSSPLYQTSSTHWLENFFFDSWTVNKKHRTLQKTHILSLIKKSLLWLTKNRKRCYDTKIWLERAWQGAWQEVNEDRPLFFFAVRISFQFFFKPFSPANGKILKRKLEVYSRVSALISILFCCCLPDSTEKKRLFKCGKVPDFLVKSWKKGWQSPKGSFFTWKLNELTQLQFEESSYEFEISSSESLSTRQIRFTRSHADEMQKDNAN